MKLIVCWMVMSMVGKNKAQDRDTRACLGRLAGELPRGQGGPLPRCHLGRASKAVKEHTVQLHGGRVSLRRKNRCKGPEVGACLECLKARRELGLLSAVSKGG